MAVNHDMKVIFPLAGAAILLILLLMLRALLAPVYLIASVVAAFAATLGASVVVFQDLAGHQELSFLLVAALTTLAGRSAWWPSRPWKHRDAQARPLFPSFYRL